jgi:hypothetical protein
LHRRSPQVSLRRGPVAASILFGTKLRSIPVSHPRDELKHSFLFCRDCGKEPIEREFERIAEQAPNSPFACGLTQLHALADPRRNELRLMYICDPRAHTRGQNTKDCTSPTRKHGNDFHQMLVIGSFWNRLRPKTALFWGERAMHCVRRKLAIVRAEIASRNTCSSTDHQLRNS